MYWLSATKSILLTFLLTINIGFSTKLLSRNIILLLGWFYVQRGWFSFELREVVDYIVGFFEHNLFLFTWKILLNNYQKDNLTFGNLTSQLFCSLSLSAGIAYFLFCFFHKHWERELLMLP